MEVVVEGLPVFLFIFILCVSYSLVSLRDYEFNEYALNIVWDLGIWNILNLVNSMCKEQRLLELTTLTSCRCRMKIQDDEFRSCVSATYVVKEVGTLLSWYKLAAPVSRTTVLIGNHLV